MGAVMEMKSGIKPPVPGPVARLMELINGARSEYCNELRSGEPKYPAWTFDAEQVCEMALQAGQAIAIADEAARSDIECHCLWTSEDPALRWLDTASIEDQERESDLRELVDRSIAYLEGRGLLIHHPEFSTWVRVAEVPKAVTGVTIDRLAAEG